MMRFPSRAKLSIWQGVLCASLWVSCAGAQSLRDPTQAPVEAGMGHDAPAGGATTSPGQYRGPVSLVVSEDGRLRLVVGTRLYGQGQMLGNERIERLTETEVWLRTGAEVRKVAVYPGVQRQRSESGMAPTCDAQRLPKTSTAQKKPSSKAHTSREACPQVPVETSPK